MPPSFAFEARYASSWALVIGINTYQKVGPLGYARQDAEAVAAALRGRCGFPAAGVTLLTDADATGAGIRQAFFRLVNGGTAANDRVVVFFAGHGFTASEAVGAREVGFLVPVDGDPGDLSTLLRWDDLTRNSALIAAKHVLFIMDACYGGLAVSRAPAPTSSRFRSDMLRRPARQVLSAGKADEVVADAGGPRPGHSVFTGHLLDGIDGAAKASDLVITANSLMGYVYDRVSRDHASRQTPHYGYIDGDGDLILVGHESAARPLESGSEAAPVDVLVQLPATGEYGVDGQAAEAPHQEIKRLLSDPRGRIQLDDRVNQYVRTALSRLSADAFPVSGPVSTEDLIDRLERYEHAIDELIAPVILLGRWSDDGNLPLLPKIIARLSDSAPSIGGSTVLLGLRWYPIECLIYAAGVSAISVDNYAALERLLRTPIGSGSSGGAPSIAAVAVVDGLMDAVRHDTFKRLPGRERNFTPKSEHLFTRLQPKIEDQLFLGSTYDDHFDRFEILYALVHADEVERQRKDFFWGPIGRFGWKNRRGNGTGPFERFVTEALALGDRWAALRCGLFAGSSARFKLVATRFREELLNKLTWF